MALSQFDLALSSLNDTPAPGISGSRIKKLTQLAVQNVKDSTRIVTQLFKHFKKAPGSHKLGALYVVDSISRAYQDLAKRNGESALTADEGSFSGGLSSIGAVITSLVNDAMEHSPPDHMDRIKKLLEIWEKSGTFGTDQISRLVGRHFGEQSNSGSISLPVERESKLASTAPSSDGSNPPLSTVAATPNTAAILQAIAQMAQASSVGPSAVSVTSLPEVFVPEYLPQPLQTAASLSAIQPSPSLHDQPLASISRPGPVPYVKANTFEEQQIQLVKLLASQGMPAAQIQTILKATEINSPLHAVPILPPFLLPMQNRPWPIQVPQDSQHHVPPWMRDHQNTDEFPTRQANIQPRKREREASRSRSPVRRIRADPSYDDYDSSLNSSRETQGNLHGRTESHTSICLEDSATGHQVYKGNSMVSKQATIPPLEKLYRYDQTAPADSIKVLSRTLFVGGVNSSVSQQTLRDLFSEFGSVQSCIVNHNARHAFVKMHFRKDAEIARGHAEMLHHGDAVLRTKWGIGFGPRDCSNYQVGISTIPLARLTEADRKWAVTAEFGGTGGKPLIARIMIEEPDIEIGAGVSSKAISKRIASSHKISEQINANYVPVGRKSANQTENTRLPLVPPNPFLGGFPGVPSLPMVTGQQVPSIEQMQQMAQMSWSMPNAFGSREHVG